MLFTVPDIATPVGLKDEMTGAAENSALLPVAELATDPTNTGVVERLIVADVLVPSPTTQNMMGRAYCKPLLALTRGGWKYAAPKTVDINMASKTTALFSSLPLFTVISPYGFSRSYLVGSAPIIISSFASHNARTDLSLSEGLSPVAQRPILFDHTKEQTAKDSKKRGPL